MLATLQVYRVYLGLVMFLKRVFGLRI